MKAHYPGFHKSLPKPRFGPYFIVFIEKNDRIGHAMQQQVIRRAELWSELVRKQVLGQDLQEEHAGPGPVGNTECSNANLGAAAPSSGPFLPVEELLVICPTPPTCFWHHTQKIHLRGQKKGIQLLMSVLQ